jgi:alkaline phosphatase D
VRTAPTPATSKEFKFVWTGDSNAYFKPYTVLDSIPEDDPDVWLYIGDTIYGDDPRSGTGVAVVRGDYHVKYKENRADNSLRNVLAALGTYSMWDDHEVTNDFWGTDPGIATQMAAGNQAYRDYLPLREDGGDPMRLYRSFQWGALAEFFLIDARQYRDAQAYVTEPACLVLGEPATLPNATCQTEIDNPARTYLGAAQKAWLKAGLLASTAKFKFVMNGPLISELLFLPYDRWEGYAAEREEILEYIEANNIKNVVFLSTDIHALIVNSEAANPGGSGGGSPEWVAGAIGMDPIYRELPGSIAPLVPTLPALFPAITHFDIDRFNYGTVEVSASEAKLSYRDNTGAVIASLTLPEE